MHPAKELFLLSFRQVFTQQWEVCDLLLVQMEQDDALQHEGEPTQLDPKITLHLSFSAPANPLRPLDAVDERDNPRMV